MKKNDQANRPYYKLLELYFEDFRELLGDLPSLKKIEFFGRLEQYLITLKSFEERFRIGQNAKEHRKKNGKSLRDLAGELGIKSAQTISNYENGNLEFNTNKPSGIAYLGWLKDEGLYDLD